MRFVPNQPQTPHGNSASAIWGRVFLRRRVSSSSLIVICCAISCSSTAGRIDSRNGTDYLSACLYAASPCSSIARRSGGDAMRLAASSAAILEMSTPESPTHSTHTGLVGR